MCGITGWIDWHRDLTQHVSVLENMTETLTPRGPDATGTWFTHRCALGHRRLSVIDPENGSQPMVRKRDNDYYTIVYNGEIYNANELRDELIRAGHTFQTHCDTEVVLVAYMAWGEACVDRLNGIFAFGIWDGNKEQLFLVRDRIGVKPLFFSSRDSMLLFGSEPKSLLAHPEIEPIVDGEGLAEIFAIGPGRTPGHGVFKQLSELKPGHMLIYSREGVRIRTYWELTCEEHEDDVDATAANVRDLLIDTVERQLISDVPVCTLLSGGLDSSALSAIASGYYRRTNRGQLTTYSVDYKDNDKHFKSNDFQPNSDAPYVKRMTEYLQSNHVYIEFDTPELVESLSDAVRARDLPGMADVDGSLYLFCREIKKAATVAVSGEAADEVFGGYPWFHRQDALNANTFPWSLRTGERFQMLSSELRNWIHPEEYVGDRYQQLLDEVPHLDGENQKDHRMREMSYMNLTRWMPTLLDRKDRMSMAVGLEVRVPFTDHRLIEYVWNIPWEIKTAGMREKGILRKALEGILPDDVLWRKKSPYPKTHNPNYFTAVKDWVQDILNDPSSPVLPFINVEWIQELARMDEPIQLPWFGQLMTGPQLFAYIAQVNTWMKEYNVIVR